MGQAHDLAEKIAAGLTAAVAGTAAVLLLSWWLGRDPIPDLAIRLPSPSRGLESAEGGSGRNAPAVDIEGQFLTFGPLPPPREGSWPHFRGPGYDNISQEAIPLAGKWGKEGPRLLWSVELGEGHAGAAVRDGLVYVLDYLEKEESDALRCFSLEDGREVWRRWYRTGAKRNHGISRTVPATDGRYVVTLGPKCQVMCVDARTGIFRWGMDLVRDWGAIEPLWFTAQCPLIDGPLAVIAPAGKVLMMGVDCATGKVAWQTPNPRLWRMSHSSVVPMTFRGRKMYVYCAEGGMAGVAAEGADAGALLWETTEWSHAVVAPSPVVFEDGRIFVTAGYGVGSALFQLTEVNGRFSIRLVRRLDRQVFACEQQTPVYHRGHLFGVLPKDGGALREQMVCLDPSGRMVWSSGKEHRYGLGPFMVAQDRVFVLSDEGVLTMAEASPSSFRVLSEARVLTGRDAWAPLALAGGRMLLRDSRRMVCLDLADGGAGSGGREGR